CAEQICQRKDRKWHRRDERPEVSPGIVATGAFRIPVMAGELRRGHPPRDNDSVFVQARTERETKVDDEQPQQSRRKGSWHLALLQFLQAESHGQDVVVFPPVAAFCWILLSSRMNVLAR